MGVATDPDWVKSLANYFRYRVQHGGYPDQSIQKTFDLVFDALRALQQSAVRRVHTPTLGAGRVDGPTAKIPSIDAAGALSYLVFEKAAGTQEAFRTFRIPDHYTGDAQFHIHWTKSDDLDRSGESVKWIVSYHVFDGKTQDAALAPTVMEFEDVYQDSGTTSRIVQRIDDQDLVGAQAGYYVAVSVRKGTPAPGPTPMVEPALVSVDFTHKESVIT